MEDPYKSCRCKKSNLSNLLFILVSLIINLLFILFFIYSIKIRRLSFFKPKDESVVMFDFSKPIENKNEAEQEDQIEIPSYVLKADNSIEVENISPTSQQANKDDVVSNEAETLDSLLHQKQDKKVDEKDVSYSADYESKDILMNRVEDLEIKVEPSAEELRAFALSNLMKSSKKDCTDNNASSSAPDTKLFTDLNSKLLSTISCGGGARDDITINGNSDRYSVVGIILANYINKIFSKIAQEFKFVSQNYFSSMDNGFCSNGFILDKDGRLLESNILETSFNAEKSKFILSLIKKAAPFLAIPDTLNMDTIRFIVECRKTDSIFGIVIKF